MKNSLHARNAVYYVRNPYYAHNADNRVRTPPHTHTRSADIWERNPLHASKLCYHCLLTARTCLTLICSWASVLVLVFFTVARSYPKYPLSLSLPPLSLSLYLSLSIRAFTSSPFLILLSVPSPVVTFVNPCIHIKMRALYKHIELQLDRGTLCTHVALAIEWGTLNVHEAMALEVRKLTTGQTTVNKKAPIHFIIPINDTVHRPL